MIDYAVIEAAIFEMAERYQVQEVAIDRWNSTATQTRLQAEGLTVAEFGQGFASMSGPVKEVERALLSGKLRHGGHPVLRWNFLNVVPDADAAGNVKFTKAKSVEKIDGAVATVMAIGRAFASETVGSVYEGRGLLTF